METNTNCDSCDYCESCKFCNFCNFCNFCINLKMTECNYFCYSKEYNSDISFQQPRYRVFNIQLSEEEYYKIDKLYLKLEFDKNESYKTRYKTAFKKVFEKLSQEDKNKIISLPWFNADDFLEYYWVDVRKIETIDIWWVKYNKSDIEKALKDIKPL